MSSSVGNPETWFNPDANKNSITFWLNVVATLLTHGSQKTSTKTNGVFHIAKMFLITFCQAWETGFLITAGDFLSKLCVATLGHPLPVRRRFWHHAFDLLV